MEPLDLLEKVFVIAKAVKDQVQKVQTNRDNCIMLVFYIHLFHRLFVEDYGLNTTVFNNKNNSHYNVVGKISFLIILVVIPFF